jgi:ribosomal protein S18 acetylase RimI-like enzyme
VTLPDCGGRPGDGIAEGALTLAPARYDDPAVADLVQEVQQVYVERYGGPDETPMAAEEFAPPHGCFVLVRLAGGPVAMGGWRLRTGPDSQRLPGRRPAEIKRMFVRPHLRGRGLARLVLDELESRARAAGVDWLVLETGERQPEAIGLYRSAGFEDVRPFGLYADEDGSVYLGKPLLFRNGPSGTVRTG